MCSLPKDSTHYQQSVLPLVPGRFTQLGSRFFTRLMPTPLQAHPKWVAVNKILAKELGLDDHFFESEQVLWALAGNGSVHKDSAHEGDVNEVDVNKHTYDGHTPLATVYSGHQFGAWAGQLGDGRAILLGESLDKHNEWQEWQLKGAGKTPYSRFGDGRAVLRSSIREYLCSEAMYALGIPTTRALALVTSEDKVYREEVETAAIVTRIAPSFIRFGHFEHFASLGDTASLKQLADFVLAHYYPECLEQENVYAAMFAQIVKRTAELIAHWQSVGFCHGVMNTDNMSILGLTIDYGPYGFLDAYDAKHICNHSDHQGRYAYQQQPYIGHWNLVRLANCFVPFVSQDTLIAILNTYRDSFEQKHLALFRQKIGLQQVYPTDASLIHDMLSTLQSYQVDFSLFFRELAKVKLPTLHDNEQVQIPSSLRALFKAHHLGNFQRWFSLYVKRLQQEDSDDNCREQAMNRINPLYVLRNYLLQQAIEKAEQGDFSEVNRLQQCMLDPFTENQAFADYAQEPPLWAAEICVSCSS